VKADTLRITGDATAGRLALRLRPGSPTALDVDVGADGTADFGFDRSTFTAIDVRAGAGDDGSFPDELVTIRGGSGADTLVGGSGTEALLGGPGDDVVAGGDGDDRALLGGGSDRFVWNPGDGSDVVEGQTGNDLLDFNGSAIGEAIDVSASNGRVRFTRNVATIALDLDGVERSASTPSAAPTPSPSATSPAATPTASRSTSAGTASPTPSPRTGRTAGTSSRSPAPAPRC
jgi:Ca2+-binding RTX toxin-like protein